MQFNNNVNVFGSTPKSLNYLIRHYKNKNISFEDLKDSITNLLSGSIDWYRCYCIESFEVYLDKLTIVGITREQNRFITNIPLS